MVQNEMLKANRMYKDTVFRMLFSDRKNLLSLYNAISGSHYDDPDKLEIVTLENAIYMGMKNYCILQWSGKEKGLLGKPFIRSFRKPIR